MKFSQTLLRGQVPEWEPFYIDYMRLKRLIRTNRALFFKVLDENLTNVNLFFFQLENQLIREKSEIFAIVQQIKKKKQRVKSDSDNQHYVTSQKEIAKSLNKNTKDNLRSNDVIVSFDDNNYPQPMNRSFYRHTDKSEPLESYANTQNYIDIETFDSFNDQNHNKQTSVSRDNVNFISNDFLQFEAKIGRIKEQENLVSNLHERDNSIFVSFMDPQTLLKKNNDLSDALSSTNQKFDPTTLPDLYLKDEFSQVTHNKCYEYKNRHFSSDFTESSNHIWSQMNRMNPENGWDFVLDSTDSVDGRFISADRNSSQNGANLIDCCIKQDQKDGDRHHDIQLLTSDYDENNHGEARIIGKNSKKNIMAGSYLDILPNQAVLPKDIQRSSHHGSKDQLGYTDDAVNRLGVLGMCKIHNQCSKKLKTHPCLESEMNCNECILESQNHGNSENLLVDQSNVYQPQMFIGDNLYSFFNRKQRQNVSSVNFKRNESTFTDEPIILSDNFPFIESDKTPTNNYIPHSLDKTDIPKSHNCDIRHFLSNHPKKLSRSTVLSDSHECNHKISTKSRRQKSARKENSMYLQCSNKITPNSSKRVQKSTLLAFINDCINIKNFSEMNLSACGKILKKFDKFYHSKIRDQKLQEIQKSHFTKLKRVEKAFNEGKLLYTKIFAKNNKKKAKSDMFKLFDTRKASYTDTFVSGFLTSMSVMFLFLIDFQKMSTISKNLLFASNATAFGTYLFGICLILWHKNFINYKNIFEFNTVRHANIGSYFMIISIIYAFSNLFFFLHLKYASNLAEWWVLIINLCLICNPLRIFKPKPRFFFLRTLAKIFSGPFFSIQFRHFYLCDCLLSFGFCYKIIYMSFTRLNIDYHILFISMIFPIFRILQCLRRYIDIKGSLQLYNCGKYFLSILFLVSGFFYSWYPNLAPYLLFLSLGVISSSCSLYWDLFYDWGILRKKRVFPLFVYGLIITYSVVCRFFWILKLGNMLYYDHIYCVMEILRRFAWSLIRVEFEHLNNCKIFLKIAEENQRNSDLFFNRLAGPVLEVEEALDDQLGMEVKVE